MISSSVTMMTTCQSGTADNGLDTRLLSAGSGCVKAYRLARFSGETASYSDSAALRESTHMARSNSRGIPPRRSACFSRGGTTVRTAS